MKTQLKSAGSIILALVAAACGGDGGSTTSVNTVTKVTVTATASAVNIGQALQLSATAYNSTNAVVSSPGTVSWASDATSVLTVDQTGRVTGVSAGNSNVSATIAGVKGTLSVRVNLAGGAAKDTIFTLGTSAFSPTFLEVERGATVIFSLGPDGTLHDVLFAAKAGAPAYIFPVANARVPVTFSTAGEFPYHCPIHPQMSGTVTVK